MSLAPIPPSPRPSSVCHIAPLPSLVRTLAFASPSLALTSQSPPPPPSPRPHPSQFARLALAASPPPAASPSPSPSPPHTLGGHGHGADGGRDGGGVRAADPRGPARGPGRGGDPRDGGRLRARARRSRCWPRRASTAIEFDERTTVTPPPLTPRARERRCRAAAAPVTSRQGGGARLHRGRAGRADPRAHGMRVRVLGGGGAGGRRLCSSTCPLRPREISTGNQWPSALDCI